MKTRKTTRGEALVHQNIQCMWIHLHKKSIGHWLIFCDGHFTKYLAELCLWKEMEQVEGSVNRIYMTKIQCSFLLARLEVVFVSSDWHITYIFPLARKKLGLGLFFFYYFLEGKNTTTTVWT